MLTQHELEIIDKTKTMVERKFLSESTGHDWRHIYRVWKVAVQIAESEKANEYIVSLAALLHDIADYKFHDNNETIGGDISKNWLQSLNVEEKIIMEVAEIINKISFKGENADRSSLSLEGQIVQDADRLDALGAIGIARVCAYGGSIERELHNPNISPKENMGREEYITYKGTTINHFYEKLLLLKDLMNTDTGKKIALHRHQYLEEFLKEFYIEREGKDLC